MVLPTPKGSQDIDISSALYGYQTSRRCGTFSSSPIHGDFFVVPPGTMIKVCQPPNLCHSVVPKSQNTKNMSEFDWTIRDHNLDILALNEINLNDTIHTSTINVPTSFNLIRCDRPNSSRGGCGMMISKKL